MSTQELPRPQSPPAKHRITRTESVDLSASLLWPGMEEEEVEESQDPSVIQLLPFHAESEQDQPASKRARKTAVPSSGADEGGKTLNFSLKTTTSSPSSETVTAELEGQQQQQQTTKRKKKSSSPTALTPFNFNELRADIIKSSFMPLSIGRMQDVHWFILGGYSRKFSRISETLPEDQTFSEETIFTMARNRELMGLGELELSQKGWVNIVVTFTLPIYQSYWPILCTCQMRETWKNIELYCYILYTQLWSHFRTHQNMLDVTGCDGDPEKGVVPLSYKDWCESVEEYAKKKASLDIRVPVGCSEKEAHSFIKARLSFLLQIFNQCSFCTDKGFPIVLFQKRPILLYKSALDESTPALALTEQNITLTHFHRTEGSGNFMDTESDKPRAIAYQAHLFPLSLIPDAA